MTTLRPDGYLETDSPIVAACFLGEEVRAVYEDGYHTWLDNLEDDREPYPILIPASVVAKVLAWGTDAYGATQAWAAIEYGFPQYEWPVNSISDWLAKHAGVTDE